MGLKLTRRWTAGRTNGRTAAAPASEIADEVLMSRYLGGDHQAFAELVHRYERELFNYLYRMLGDSSVAEDVFQNTFLTVHTKKHLFGEGRPFRPWLYTLATNQAIDTMRRNGRHQRPSLDRRHAGTSGESETSLLDMLATSERAPVDSAEREELARLVRASVDALPEHLRSAIVLCYYQGLKYAEVASALGIPVGTVKSRLHAAIVRLGEDWKRLGIDPPES